MQCCIEFNRFADIAFLHWKRAWLVMGSEQGKFQLQKAEPNLNYYCLTIRETNTIRIIHAPADVKALVRKVIKCNWPPGVSAEMEEVEYWELKLKGTPFWNSFNSEYALRVHRLMCLIVQELYAGGYEIIISSDLSRIRDLSTFFIKKSAVPPKELQNMHIFTVTLSGENLLYLTNIPKGTKQELVRILKESWGKGVKKETYYKSGIVIALGGKPWMDMKSMSVAARSLLHKLINFLGMTGWDLVTTARVKNARDTFFFRKTRGHPAINDLVRSFFSLSINGKDKLRILHSSAPSIVDDLRRIITLGWEGEIVSETMKNGSYEFEIKGDPFWCESTEAIQTRYLMIKILEILQERGFRVQCSVNPSSRLVNKGLIIFRKCIPTHLKVICISFDENDRIRIMNAPEDFINCVKSVLQDRYKSGLIKESTFRRAFDFKIRGEPWSGINVNDGIEARSMMCHLLQKVTLKGWRVVLSMDATSCSVKSDDRKDHPQDVHSWYLMRTDTVNKAICKWKTSNA